MRGSDLEKQLVGTQEEIPIGNGLEKYKESVQLGCTFTDWCLWNESGNSSFSTYEHILQTMDTILMFSSADKKAVHLWCLSPLLPRVCRVIQTRVIASWEHGYMFLASGTGLYWTTLPPQLHLFLPANGTEMVLFNIKRSQVAVTSPVSPAQLSWPPFCSRSQRMSPGEAEPEYFHVFGLLWDSIYPSAQWASE